MLQTPTAEEGEKNFQGALAANASFKPPEGGGGSAR